MHHMPVGKFKGQHIDDIPADYLWWVLRTCTALQGQYGRNPTTWAPRALVYGFDLGIERGLALLLAHYNPRCRPPWSEAERANTDAAAASGQPAHQQGRQRQLAAR